MQSIALLFASSALFVLSCAQPDIPTTGSVGGSGSNGSSSGGGSGSGGSGSGTGGGGSAQLKTSGYQPSAAVAYADANWDDGVGLCAQFTTDSLRAGSLAIAEITYVPTLFEALAGIPYEEHVQGDTPNASGGDVVIYSDATGDAFCDDDSDEYNCGHTCIVSTGGQGENTITVDCHNNAHYQLPLGDILGGGYSTYRVYHLSTSAPPGTIPCTTDYDCNQGNPGTEDVCAAGEDYCITGCHSDYDCPSGLTCEPTEPHWSCQ